MRKRDIRKVKWYEEVVDFFNIDEKLIKASVTRKRIDHERESINLTDARTRIADQFMSPEAIELWERIRTDSPDELTDEQLEQAMDQLGIDKQTLSDEDQAYIDQQDDGGETGKLDEIERILYLIS